MRIPLPPCLAPPPDGACWAPPLDVQDVVVRLEAAGITDRVAKREYGFENLWALAESCFAAPPFPAVKQEPRRTSVLREYLDGISFALPLLLCVLSMAWLDYSLWGGDVPANMAAAAGLGTVTSFITTGGFVQVMARRSLFYLGMQDGTTAAAVCLRWGCLAAASLLAVGLLIIAFTRAYQWLPAPYDLAAFAFHMALGLLWIAAGMLQMLQRNIWSALATAVGIVVVVSLYGSGTMPLVASQICGIFVALLVAFAASIVLLRRRRRPGNMPPRATALAEDLYYAWPYFLYGSLYYGLVFTDRLLSWTAPSAGAPASVQFRGDYETALDVALVSFILQVGFVQVFTRDFFDRLRLFQEGMRVALRSDFLFQMNTVYINLGGRLLILSAAIAAGLCAAVGSAYVAPPVLYQTFVLAVAGNFFLVLALWNANLLFRLSRPLDVVLPISIALVTDLVVGYLASRWGVHHYAIYGFLAGTIVFFVLTFANLLARCRCLDFYHFAADA